MRFRSIAGTLKSTDWGLSDKSSPDERHITHILIRSLIENYFNLIYIFNDPKESESRYSNLLGKFKIDYCKLMNEEAIKANFSDELIKPDDDWSNIKNQDIDLKSKLSKVSDGNDGNMSFLYFIYRVSSFDTHGRSLKAISKDAFGEEDFNFPILKVDRAIEVISEQYIDIICNLDKY